MADLLTEFSNIPPAFLCDFLSPEEEDTLFLNDLEEEFVICFLSYWYSFSVQIRKNRRLLRTHGSLRSL